MKATETVREETSLLPPIGIDTRAISRGPAGIRTYVSNLVRYIPELQPLATPWPSNNLIWNQTVPVYRAWREKWRLYHAPSYTSPLHLPCPLVVTAPDVSYLVNPDWYPYHLGALRLRYYTASLRAADRIIVTSHFSRQELARVLPEVRERIRCTHLAASPDFRAQPSKVAEIRQKFRLPDAFLLHVGDLHLRRNLPLLRQVADTVGLPLVLVGRVLESHAADTIGPHHLENVSLSDLIGLYSAATVLVYASLYEGFGLPLLEAFACELPVVAARTSCIPEICGEAAILVEPELDDFCQGVREALSRKSQLVELGKRRAGEFSWEATAAATREIYREIVS